MGHDVMAQRRSCRVVSAHAVNAREGCGKVDADNDLALANSERLETANLHGVCALLFSRRKCHAQAKEELPGSKPGRVSRTL